jgi:hypothetical protein
MRRKRGNLRPRRPSQLPAPGQRRTRVLALVLTVAAHVLVLTALFWPHAAPLPPKPELAPIEVTLLPTPPAPPDPLKLAPSDFQNEIQPAAPQVALPALTIAKTPNNTSDLLSASQIAGAAGVGEGGGGGGNCDTARAVQQALQRDPLVRNAVEDAHRLGKSIMLWNGDWVRTGDQEGKGLSAVREAIVWQIAFAPEACRNRPMHGLVLLSLTDGSTHFAIGSGNWRWTDLLGVGRSSDR